MTCQGICRRMMDVKVLNHKGGICRSRESLSRGDCPGAIQLGAPYTVKVDYIKRISVGTKQGGRGYLKNGKVGPFCEHGVMVAMSINETKT